ncbi:hypothetical protein PRIC1_007922 [Phytophthora ramorum]
MRTRVVVMMAALLVVGCAGEEAVMREKRLRVVSKVHANVDVFVGGEEKRAKRHGHCVDTGDVNEDPVCASNGRQYLNEDVFEFHQCLIKAEYGEVIEVVDMDICKSAKKEDGEHPDVPDIDYMS